MYVKYTRQGFKRTLVIVASAFACASWHQNASASDTEIKIGGAGTTLGTMKELGEAYSKVNPEIRVTVPPSLGAVGGVNALLSGALDVATSTRKLTDADRASEVSVTEIARIPFVFAVSTSSKVSGVTSAELLDIYQGKLTTWPDGSRIRLVLRPSSVSDTIFLKDLSPAWKKTMMDLEQRPGMIVVATAQEAADLVEKTPGALTTSTINLIVTEKRAMKALHVDGVEPNSKNVAEGQYRYYKPVLLVTPHTMSPRVQKFIAFVRSPAGREILIRTGHVPVDNFAIAQKK